MEFLKNPFQKKFIPTIIALLVGVMCTAIDHGAHRLVPALVWLVIAAAQIISADAPIRPLHFWMYVATGSVFSALAVMMVFVGAFQAAAIAGAIAAFPLSVLFTRKREEKNDVQ